MSRERQRQSRRRQRQRQSIDGGRHESGAFLFRGFLRIGKHTVDWQVRWAWMQGVGVENGGQERYDWATDSAQGTGGGANGREAVVARPIKSRDALGKP